MKNNKPSWDTIFTGANGRISSKRVLGYVILITLLVVIVICTFTNPDITWLGEAFITMMIGAFALLGIGVFEKRFQKPIPGDMGYEEQSETVVGTEDEENQST